MKKLILFVAMGFAVISVSGTAFGLLVLDPEKDMKVVKKEVVNEDGTTSVVEEVIITRRPTLPEVDMSKVEGAESKEKIQHARGWDRKLGKYEPREPMLKVTTERPENWPIPVAMGRARDVPSAQAEESSSSLHWFAAAICLGIVAFAGFRLYFHVQEKAGPA